MVKKTNFLAVCLLTGNTASFNAVVSSALLPNGTLTPRAICWCAPLVLDPIFQGQYVDSQIIV